MERFPFGKSTGNQPEINGNIPPRSPGTSGGPASPPLPAACPDGALRQGRCRTRRVGPTQRRDRDSRLACAVLAICCAQSSCSQAIAPALPRLPSSRAAPRARASEMTPPRHPSGPAPPSPRSVAGPRHHPSHRSGIGPGRSPNRRTTRLSPSYSESSPSHLRVISESAAPGPAPRRAAAS